MHVECARRAEYYMMFDPEIETLEFYCSKHRPLPLKTELLQSINEQITNITEFAENYQAAIKENAIQIVWTDEEQFQLIQKVAHTFFELSKLTTYVEFKPDTDMFEIAQEASNDGVGLLPGNKDWKVTLNYKDFPWRSISVKHHDSIDCWKKYWDMVGLSEDKFKQKIMSQNKTNLQKYIKFVRLRQQKISSDLKDKQRVKVLKEIPVVTQPDQVSELLEAKTVQDTIEQPEIKEVEKVDQTQKIEQEEVIETPKVQEMVEESKVEEIVKEEEAATIEEQINEVIEETEQDKQEKKNGLVLEKLEKLKKGKREKLDRKNMKRMEKMKEKKESLIEDPATKIITCYCKCQLSSIFQLKNSKRKQRGEARNFKDNELSDGLVFPKFLDKQQEEDYRQQLKTPGNRCTKSGTTRCSNKDNCLLGAYFHVECCYNQDPSFDMKKKARDKWFCMECRKHLPEDDKSKEPKSPTKSLGVEQQLDEESKVSKVEPIKDAQVVEEVLEVQEVKDVKVDQVNKIKGEEGIKLDEVIVLPEKRSSKRLQKRPQTPEVLKSATKRQKLNDEPLDDQVLTRTKTEKPIENKPDAKLQEPLEPLKIDLQLNKRSKRTQQSKEYQLAEQMISDLLKKVESTLPEELTLKDQSVFMQFKKAFEKHTNFLQTPKDTKEIEEAIETKEIKEDKLKDDVKNIEIMEVTLPQTQTEPTMCEIEIKIDPVKQQPTKASKKVLQMEKKVSEKTEATKTQKVVKEKVEASKKVQPVLEKILPHIEKIEVVEKVPIITEVANTMPIVLEKIVPVVVEKIVQAVGLEKPALVVQAIQGAKTEQAQKLSLSQQFLLNLQRNLPQKQETIITMPQVNPQLVPQFVPEQVLELVEEPIYVPIQLQIDKPKATVTTKVKSKKNQDKTNVKMNQEKTNVKFHSIHEETQNPTENYTQNQPVTICCFNTLQDSEKMKNGLVQKTGHLSDVCISQPSHSPPGGHQNPLEPKLAAGPASGYPNQAQNGSQQTFIQPAEQPFVIDVPKMGGSDIKTVDEAELKRKLEKRERKRLRKEERKRREMESGLIQIDTQPILQQESSMISIITSKIQNEPDPNLIQLQTDRQIVQSSKLSKKKKSKKPKEMDIVIDTTTQANNQIMIPTSIPMSYPYENNQHMASELQNNVNMYQSQYNLYMQQYQVPQQMQTDDFVISIPLEPSQQQQQKPHLTKVEQQVHQQEEEQPFDIILEMEPQKHTVEKKSKKSK